MSRGLAIFVFWILGFAIGAGGYLAVTWLGNILPSIVVNEAILGAILAGVIGSAVSTFTIVTWASKE
jgi:hypothetical protein